MIPGGSGSVGRLLSALGGWVVDGGAGRAERVNVVGEGVVGGSWVVAHPGPSSSRVVCGALLDAELCCGTTAVGSEGIASVCST